MEKEIKLFLPQFTDASASAADRLNAVTETILNFFGDEWEEKTSFEKTYTHQSQECHTICIGYKENDYPELVFCIDTGYNSLDMISGTSYSSYYSETNMRYNAFSFNHYFRYDLHTPVYGCVFKCKNGLKYFKFCSCANARDFIFDLTPSIFFEGYASYNEIKVKTFYFITTDYASMFIWTRTFDEFDHIFSHDGNTSAGFYAGDYDVVVNSMYGTFDDRIAIIKKLYFYRENAIEITGPVFIRMKNSNELRDLRKGITIDGKSYRLIYTANACNGYVMMPDFKE